VRRIDLVLRRSRQVSGRRATLLVSPLLILLGSSLGWLLFLLLIPGSLKVILRIPQGTFYRVKLELIPV
jgi:hypothetical protein